MVRQKQILVLASDKLLAASIVSLLASRPEFSVSNTTAGSLAFSDQSQAQLDVVIVEEAQLAANILAIVQLTNRHPTLRLIVLGLKDNKLQVFDKHMVQVSQVSDLLELLENPSS